MLKKEDGLIDWNREPQTIRNLVRGIDPLARRLHFSGGQNAEDLPLPDCRRHRYTWDGAAGRQVGTGIACRNGGLMIDELQLEGKKRLSAKDFLAGYNIKPGFVLEKRGLSRD